MTVGLRLKFEGATQEQYDEMYRQTRIENDPPEGLIFHSGGPIDGGWGVIDFWESREGFDRFVAERLGPAADTLGSHAAPARTLDVKEFPVHDYSRPWLVRWGSFAWSASSPLLSAARGAAGRLLAARRRPLAEEVSAERLPAKAAAVAEDRQTAGGGAAQNHPVDDGGAAGDSPTEGGRNA